MSLSVYVGHYFTAPTIESKHTANNRQCSECAKPASRNAAFCSACGKPVVEASVEQTVTRLLTVYDLKGAWTDVVALIERRDGTGTWIPNKFPCGERFETGGEEPTVWDAERITADRAQFLALHEPLIAAVKEQYGIRLHVSFGVVADNY